MPLSRHTVGNEYALGGRDLYRAADQHDPEAVLDGVAMAGLVGVLRQLGDLAEFSAQVFHGLYDEVMSTSARGHGLMLRVQQLEAELPLLEKESCQRDYLYVASNSGGYDIGGEGACLKRYTDPSFFKTDSACSTELQEGIQSERRPLKAMEIRPNLQNGEIFRPPGAAGTDSKPEADLSGAAMDEAPMNRRRLKYRQLNGSVFQTFRPHMQNLYEKASSEEKPPTLDQSEVHISMIDSPDSNTEERDIMVDTSANMDKVKVTVHKNRSISDEALSRSSDARSAGSSKGYSSEVDIYVDALTTMDSEAETDSEHRDHGHHAFARMDSDNTCSGIQHATASRSSSFEKKDSADVASANRDMSNQHEEAIVSTPQIKPVAGEHERTSSLEELIEREKPASWDHERSSSLEELLTEDFLASESGVRDQANEEPGCYGSVSNVESNGTQDITKKSKEAKENSSITTISFKKIASKRSKYVGSMELIASKVGILPRKLSKKHDPFSDSLRSMAKQLLELKYDGTQDSDLYDFEANSEGCNVKYLEMYDPPVEIESAVHKISSDPPHDDLGSRKCQQEELNHESEHDVPPTDSPHDSVPEDRDVFQDSNIVYLTGSITSPSSQEEEGCASTAPDEHSSTGVLNHILEHAQEKFEEHPDREVTEDTHTEVISENASDTGEDLKEVSIYTEQVNAEDTKESNNFDACALDDETAEYIEEQEVSDGNSSPVSSKQSDDPCRITPLPLADEDDTVACKVTDSCTPELEHITLSETFTDTDLPKVVTESVINSEDAMPDDDQYYLHSEPTFGKDTVLSSSEIVVQNGQGPLCSSSTVAVTPELTVNIEEKHELHPVEHQEPPNPCDSNTEVFGEPPTPESRDVLQPIISSFDWMLNGAVQQSLNVLPAQLTYGNAQENGSSEDAPPLPPLPPMQWRTNKLQMGSTPLSAKIGRPPRPKPPAKHQESEGNSSLDKRNENAEILQKNSLHIGSSLQNEMVQATVPDDHETNQFLNRDSQENHCQGDKEYDVDVSNPPSLSEVECAAEVASVKSENLHTSQLHELIVIPEEAWSEFGNIKFIPEQEGKHQMSNGIYDCSGLYNACLSTQKTNEKHEIFVDCKDKEFSAAGSNKVANSEENKSNGAPKQDDMPNSDLPAQQENGEHVDSDDKARELSSALEEELAKSPTHPVPKPPRYPLLQVTSHDRSMLRKALTLVQPSSKLSVENNTILEQIKNKSFNLKPVLAKRPSVMGGPRTNLQVVAIIERAHAIRQAVADDDDEDSWSE
ncbi:Protein SCAR2 [Dichanthelium oligosanthes]|uniref:Protein SCAR n=1 Tax=Dichanthelium oligosanthes TaxID=888268 RepID=A0A1E5UZV3_9POAL|nr:Protein SCAR2 [Dichanthelium oligosanthes]